MSKHVPKIVFMVSDTLLTYTTGKLNEAALERLVFLLSSLHNSGKHVILVTAGAIMLGADKLNMKERPQSLSEKQAIAAVGQVELMKAYQKHFNDYNQIVAQILVRRNLILEENRKARAYDTIQSLLSMDIIPIINENDSVSTADIELEDNYPLAVDVATIVDADFIIVTSDIQGRYNILQKHNFNANMVNSEEELHEKLDEIIAAKEKGTEEKAFPEFLHEIKFQLENL